MESSTTKSGITFELFHCDSYRLKIAIFNSIYQLARGVLTHSQLRLLVENNPVPIERVRNLHQIIERHRFDHVSITT